MIFTLQTPTVLLWNNKQYVFVKPETFILSHFCFSVLSGVFPLTNRCLNNICIRILESHKGEK